jgi:PPOX class probable F420-dependent enzyme
MRLAVPDCLARLGAASHGVLATHHPADGIDAVPVCFVLAGDHLVVPVDTVKAKRSTRLQRSADLAADPRATLLCEHWDDHDWDRLWWVRARLRHVAMPDASLCERGAQGLRAKYPRYRAHDAIADLLVLEVLALSGWSAR